MKQPTKKFSRASLDGFLFYDRPPRELRQSIDVIFGFLGPVPCLLSRPWMFLRSRSTLMSGGDSTTIEKQFKLIRVGFSLFLFFLLTKITPGTSSPVDLFNGCWRKKTLRAGTSTVLLVELNCPPPNVLFNGKRLSSFFFSLNTLSVLQRLMVGWPCGNMMSKLCQV